MLRDGILAVMIDHVYLPVLVCRGRFHRSTLVLFLSGVWLIASLSDRGELSHSMELRGKSLVEQVNAVRDAVVQIKVDSR